MSSSSTKRVLERFDYRVYSKTGRKVAKECRQLKRVTEGFTNISNMDAEKIVLDEKKLCLKIKRFFDENNIETLVYSEDIELGISELRVLVENYEAVHVELKQELENYDDQYADFDTTINKMSSWRKNAKVELRRRKAERDEKEERLKYEREEKEDRLRKEKEEREERLRKEERELRIRIEKEEKEERLKKEKDNLRVAVRHFSKRIDRELLSIKEGSTFIEDMERNIIHIRKLIEDHSELFVRIW